MNRDERSLLSRGERRERVKLGARQHERLLAEDVERPFERPPDQRGVRRGRRRDVHEVECLLLVELLRRAVEPRFGQRRVNGGLGLGARIRRGDDGDVAPLPPAGNVA